MADNKIAVSQTSAIEQDIWTLPDGRMFAVNPDYYLASCDKCGWIGSSEECGDDWNLGLGDSDVYCPNCGEPGADGGKVSETAQKEAK